MTSTASLTVPAAPRRSRSWTAWRMAALVAFVASVQLSIALAVDLPDR